MWVFLTSTPSPSAGSPSALWCQSPSSTSWCCWRQTAWPSWPEQRCELCAFWCAPRGPLSAWWCPESQRRNKACQRDPHTHTNTHTRLVDAVNTFNQAVLNLYRSHFNLLPTQSNTPPPTPEKIQFVQSFQTPALQNTNRRGLGCRAAAVFHRLSDWCLFFLSLQGIRGHANTCVSGVCSSRKGFLFSFFLL